MEYIESLVITLFLINSANTESITVTSPYGSACGTHYLSSGEELDIHYYGRNFDGQCMIEVHSFGTKHLCVLAESMVIDNECSVKVKYYKGSSWTSSPEETYDCIENSASKWCPDESHIKIGISRNGIGGTIGYNIHLKVKQTDSDLDDIVSTVVQTTYIIIGCVIGAIVLISIIVIIVICCVCNKRRNTRGTVYQNAQQPSNQVPIGAYPTAATTPYPQAGVYPQAGYQPAVQTGYQPGYQPPPMAPGYQMGPNMEYKSESAPPVEPVQPPPYSAN